MRRFSPVEEGTRRRLSDASGSVTDAERHASAVERCFCLLSSVFLSSVTDRVCSYERIPIAEDADQNGKRLCHLTSVFCPLMRVSSHGDREEFSSEREGHLVDALAPRGDEGRGTLR